MTTITVYRAAQGAVSGFTAEGHAQSARAMSNKTYDLVCAAVSALTQTGVNALYAVAKVTPQVAVDENRGYISCMLSSEEAAARDAQVVLETVIQGLKDIAQIYPKHVRVQEKELEASICLR